MNPTKEQLDARIRDSGQTPVSIPVDYLNSPAPTPIKISTPPVDNTDYASMIAGGTAMLGSIKTPTATDTPATTEPAWYTKLLTSLKPTEPASMVDQYNTEATALGIDEKTKKVNESKARLDAINAELAGISAESTASQLKSEYRQVPMSVIRGEQAQIERARAIRALPLQAQALAEQAVLTGNKALLESAQSKLDTVFQLKVKDAEATYNRQKDTYDKVWDYATDAEKAILDEKKAQLTTNNTQYTNFINDVRSVSKDAIGQGTISADLARLVTTLDPSSKTFQSDYLKAQSDFATLQGKVKLPPKQITTPTGITGVLSGTTKAIIDNPSLFDDLTATLKGTVVNELQANGYDTSNLGVKGLSDTAITTISQTQKALSDLAELKTLVEGKADQLGPLKGMSALNPYSSARKLQADVNRVRQTVGKALEGGVLRKEDEEKYKQILATLTDTPSTASYKIDALISSISRDIENYKSLQLSSGKSLDVGASLQKKGTTTNTVDWQKKYNY